MLALFMVFSFSFIGCDWLNSLFDDLIDYTVIANGSSSVTTTMLTFEFDEEVEIEAKDITITNGTGTATRGTLSGSEQNYTLNVNVTKAGTIEVSVKKTGVKSAAKEVTVYFASVTGPVQPKTLLITGLTFKNDSYFEVNLYEKAEDIGKGESLVKFFTMGKLTNNFIFIDELDGDEPLAIGLYYIELIIVESYYSEEYGDDIEATYYFNSKTAVNFNKQGVIIDFSDFYDALAPAQISLSGTFKGPGEGNINEGFMLIGYFEPYMGSFISLGSQVPFNIMLESPEWSTQIDQPEFGTEIRFRIMQYYYDEEADFEFWEPWTSELKIEYDGETLSYTDIEIDFDFLY